MMTERKKGVWSESALRVLKERYLLKDDAGNPVEDADGMLWRVAGAVASAEDNFPGSGRSMLRTAEEFYDIMVEQKFLPNSPTLMNAGTGNGHQLSACYVLPVEDSLEGIFNAVKWQALVHASGGGTGFAFSRLRPNGSVVKTTQGVASGPVSFMKIFDAATEQIKQGGKRRGANMGILRVDHPDILEFIDCKLEGGITNFNISVGITNPFMDAIRNDTAYDLVNPHNGQVAGQLKAREVFQKIVDAAWRTGDPGLVFIDRINQSTANPTPDVFQIEATNPCGEQPLAPFDACNLGSINLCRFVKMPGQPGANGKPAVDWADLERVTRLAVRFLDDVIEINPYPLPEIDQMVRNIRRIGLGVMGWADMLYMMGLPYDSEEAVVLGNQVMEFITRIGHEESEQLAVERGPFPLWDRSIFRTGKPIRNSTVTTIAPTGTISIIAGCSSGIEPMFALAFRHIVGERRLTFVNPVFEEVAEKRGFNNETVMQAVARQGSARGVAGIPEDVQRTFVTAFEVAPEWHVRMQAAFQAHTDNGVSKTINMPFEATREDVFNAYLMAWELGCLGITVFRTGSKGEQVLYVGTDDNRQSEDGSATAAQPAEAPKAAAAVAAPAAVQAQSRPVVEPPAPELEPATQMRPRPRRVHGYTYRAETPLGTAFVTVNHDDRDEPMEVFLNVGKAGSDTQAVAEALGRLMSLVLRMPSTLSARTREREIVGQLTGIGGGRAMGFGRARVRSLPDAIAHVLADDLGMTPAPSLPDLGFAEASTEDVQPVLPGMERHFGDLCPECGHGTLVFEEGCQKCYSCGYSEC